MSKGLITERNYKSKLSGGFKRRSLLDLKEKEKKYKKWENWAKCFLPKLFERIEKKEDEIRGFRI